MNYKLLAPDIKKKLEELQGQFQGAIKFLKNTVIHKNGKKLNLACLPWYLMMGATGAGKTTLLANAEINYILAKQFKSENNDLPSSDACNWWVTRDLVLVDVPGLYLNFKYRALWQSLLQMFKKSVYRKNKLQGIIVMLNLPELMLPSKNQEKIEIFLNLKRRLKDIIKLFGDAMPIHLVITKCDFLPGFTDFFSESSRDDIAQAWGVTLLPSHPKENLISVFSQRFNALIKRLNNQLIRHLHQERDATARSCIKDFPLHIEQLKELIIEFLKTMETSTFLLRSVYLTSGTQYDPLSQETTALSSMQSLDILSIPKVSAHAYFVRQLILHHWAALPAQSEAIKNKYFWQQKIAYSTAIGALVMASVLLGRDFQYSVQQAYSVQNDLSKYQFDLQKSHHKNEHLIQALPLLNSLRKAANVTTDKLSFKLSLSFYSNKAKKTANEVYRQALQTIVLPDIKNNFESYLKTASAKNPEQVYSVLEAYLMLADARYFQADFIVGIVQKLMTNEANKISIAALTELKDHLRSALIAERLSIPLDFVLVTEVRKQLLNLPSSALGFVILKNKGSNNKDSVIDLGAGLSNPPIFTSKAVATSIPAMFTASAFNQVTHEINAAASEALQGNWVLGGNSVVSDQASIDVLAAELHTQYIANYIDIWESLLANIQMDVPHDMMQLNNRIAVLTSNNSPLLRLLDTIRANTSLAPITLASPKLQSLSVLLANANDTHKSSALYGIFVSLQELHAYLEAMVNRPERDEAIFQTTVQRMKDSSNDPITHIYLIAEQSPEPMKTWLNMIAMKSWYFMLQETSQYIENAWQRNVVGIFHSDIVGFYPFNSAATQSVNVQKFRDFFKPQGVLTSFYSNYLQPFVDNTQEKLQWRSVNNQKPLFSSTILEQLERAAHLQQLFFPKGDDQVNTQALVYLSTTNRRADTVSPVNFAQIKLPDQLAG